MVESNYNRLIIDGNNFIFRAYHTKRPPVEFNGKNTTPIHQFLYMLKSAASQFKPDEIVLTWDKKTNSGSTNFRKQLVAYKEQRIITEDTLSIFEYVTQIQEITESLGILNMFPHNFEADDIIRFLANIDNRRNIIISSDKDLLQLIDHKTHVFLPLKNIIVTEENFEEIVGIKQNCFLFYKAILGDISDNIGGLSKYGLVKSKKLAEEIVEKGICAEDIYSYPANSKFVPADFKLDIEQLTKIRMNLIIMNLNLKNKELEAEDVIYHKQYTENKHFFNVDEFKSLCQKYNFTNFIREIGTWRTLFDKQNMEINTSELISYMSM